PRLRVAVAVEQELLERGPRDGQPVLAARSERRVLPGERAAERAQDEQQRAEHGPRIARGWPDLRARRGLARSPRRRRQDTAPPQAGCRADKGDARQTPCAKCGRPRRIETRTHAPASAASRASASGPSS